MTNPFAQQGGSPQKQPRYVAIFQDRMFTGLYTQRAVLHDPSDVYTARFYGGRPDALLGGRNIELTNRLTLQRRPGVVAFNNVNGNGGYLYPTVPNRAFSFQLSNGAIQVIIDTGSSGSLAITSANNASAGTTVYNGTFPGGASNGYVGLSFTVAGFVTNAGNNGVFTCTASTATTLTLNNSIGIAETIAATAITAGGVYLDNQDGTASLLFAKSAGAGQSYFIAVAGILYMGDGVDTRKYTPLNTNGKLWNWGIVPPTSQPTVVITPSGSASTVWQAHTVFSTMGLTKDATGTPKIWQVIGTNADGSNPNSQFGTTGNGAPDWPTVEGNTVTDGSVVWTNAGNINKDWTPNTFFTDLGHFGLGGTNYSQPAAFNNMGLKTLYGNYRNSGGLGNTGPASSEPHFNGAYPGPSGGYFDNNCHWFAIGTYATSAQLAQLTWKPTTAYTGWQAGGSNDTTNSGNPQCVLTAALPAPAGTPVYLMVPTTGGTSGSGYAPFPTVAAIGQVVTDGQLTWLCMGQAAWQSNHTYTPWTAQGNTFGVIYDGSNFQVCLTATGPSGGSTPSWATGYGSTTIDGGVTWVCVGPTVSWSSSQIWNLPTAGFAPPQPSQAFGGSSVEVTISAVNYIEAVVSSGTSGASAPTWPLPTATPPTVTDGSITWQAVGKASTNSLAWSYGLCYGYAYKARPLTDYYSPAPLGGGATPPGGVALGAPFGSETNAISSCSPPYQITGSNTGSVNTISGNYSPDPQCDTIVIYRSADTASGSANMFELTEIPNVPALAGVSKWSFNDYLPSVASGSFPGLNVLLPAPIDSVNNPPLSTFLPQVYNYQRIWGSNGQQVNFSGGPDTAVGNPNEAFNPSDELPFLAPVIRLVKTPQGIVTFLTDSIEMIGGGPATATFFSVTMAPGIGLLSYNACDVFAGEIYFFSADNQFRVITPGLNVSNFGFALGDQFANQPSFGSSDTTWNPANVYVAVHQNGTDNCIFVADGATGWYRLNPHQIPGAAQGPEPIWSPYASFSATLGGAKLVQSVETSPGVKQLLVGPTTPLSQIAARKLGTYSDLGLSYDAYFKMGSIKLAENGQLALLKFLEFDFSGVSLQPTVSYLLNEISGSYTNFVNNPALNTPQFDPPSIYGETLAPTSYSPNRYYFAANASLARAVHMQIGVDFGGGFVNASTSISSVEILSNVLTLTVGSTTGFVVGEPVKLSGLTNATFLNGQTITPTSLTPTTIVANFTHADYLLHFDQSESFGNQTTGVTTFAFPAATPQVTQEAAIMAIPFTPLTSTPITFSQIGTSGLWQSYPVQTPMTLTGTMASINYPAGAYCTIPCILGGPTYIQNASVAVGTGNSATLASNVTAGNTILVGIQTLGSGSNAPLAVPFTDNHGNSYTTLASKFQNFPGNRGIQILAAFAVSVGGSYTLTIGSIDPSISSGTLVAIEVSGFTTLVPADTGTATTTYNTGSTNGDELYSMAIFGRHIVEA